MPSTASTVILDEAPQVIGIRFEVVGGALVAVAPKTLAVALPEVSNDEVIEYVLSTGRSTPFYISLDEREEIRAMLAERKATAQRLEAEHQARKARRNAAVIDCTPCAPSHGSMLTGAMGCL